MRGFIEKVTAKRQEAANNNMNELSTTYKLVANSSYGRLV